MKTWVLFTIVIFSFVISAEAKTPYVALNRVKSNTLEDLIPTYTLRMVNGQRHKEYTLKVNYLTGHENTLHTALRVGENGTLCDHHNAPYTLSPLGMGLGEPLWLSLFSKDEKEHFNVKFIPRPLEVSFNGYTLTLEVTDALNQTFSLHANGFDPHEKISIIMKSPVDNIDRDVATSKKGELISTIKHPGKRHDGGESTLEIQGKNGSITIKYPWGVAYRNEIKQIQKQEKNILRSQVMTGSFSS